VLARFTVVAAIAASQLFSSAEPLALDLKAPLNDLFAHARTDDTYAVRGTLVYHERGQAVTIDDVKVSVRGNTSRRESECAFPKLKVQLPDAARRTARLFDGLDSIKIGTHCGEAADNGITIKFGRLPNEHSPLRELFVYHLLEAVGMPTLKARGAKITYIYSDPQPARTPRQDEPLVRQAMLVEDTEAAVKRLGGTHEINEKDFTNARAQFPIAETARLAFAEAMIGNFDWCLKMADGDRYRCNARHPLWNVVAAANADGQARPLMYDFDVSGIVTGHHPWFTDVFTAEFSPTKSPAETEVLAQIQRTRSLFSRWDLDAARRDFMNHKADAYKALDQSGLDAGGRRIARQYLDSFYRAIATDDAFYRPVVVDSDARLYGDANRRAVCSASGTIPIGTPVSQPLQTNGGLVQVWILDALWHWAPPARCAAVHEGPVWIEAGAISRDYPSR